MSSSAHIDKDILVHGKGPTQGLEHTIWFEFTLQWSK